MSSDNVSNFDSMLSCFGSKLMSNLVETACVEEISLPWLYLNKCHRKNTGSEATQKRDGFSEEFSDYLQMKRITEDTDESVCAEYEEFLKETEHSSFRLDGFKGSDSCIKNITGIQHRNNPEYRKMVWAKIQCLNEWYKQNPTPISMITLTVYQRDLAMWEMFDLLKAGYQRVRKMIHKYLGAVPYVWVIEPHPNSGHPHMHLLVFSDVPQSLQDKLTVLWMTKYNPGASIPGHRCEQSIDFEIKQAQTNLKSAAAYVFSYVGKTLNPELLQDRKSVHFLFSAWVWKMSQRKTDYKGVRLWDSSQDLKEVMKSPENPNSDIDWFRLSVKVPANEKHKAGWFPLWVSEDMAVYPERIKEFDESLAELDQDSMKSCKDVIFI